MVIAVCAVLGAAWPRPSDDAHVIWRGLYSLVNALGANFGKAKNADDAQAALGLRSTIKPAAKSLEKRRVQSQRHQPQLIMLASPSKCHACPGPNCLSAGARGH